MILQGESYEFWYCLPDSRFFPVCNPETSSRVTLATLGTVFQTDFVALLDVACWMLLVGSLLVGYRLLDIACWLVACWQYWQSTKQQNHKTTRQQDNKKNAYRNLHIGWSFHRSRVRLFMQSEVFP